MAPEGRDPRSRSNVLRFYRGARRHPTWDMGRPPRPRWPRRGRGWRWLARLAIFVPVVALVAIKAGDAVNGVLKADGDCAVVRLIDGDTVEAWCSSGLTRVRLDGFDTAEIFSPGCFAERVTGYRGLMALRLALYRAGGIEMTGTATDRYGRRLMTLRVDGTPVGAGLIRQGLAVPYRGGRRIDWCEPVLRPPVMRGGG